MRSLASIVTTLAEAQTEFLQTADCIPSHQWTLEPSSDSWSAAEVVAHLIMVERRIVGDADRITRNAPRPVPFLKRAHFPMWLVKARIVRRKSPIPLDPQLISGKEEMLGELRAVRERALAFLEETRNRDMSSHRWPHPFLGTLNTYEWFVMIAAHQTRHTKQMKEIRKRLPKVVGNSQN